MTRVIVQAWDDENTAGFAWHWEVWVSRRTDGSFSVGATQTTDMQKAARVRTRTRLRSAAKVLASLEAVIAETGYGIAPDAEIFEEIVMALAGFDPVLAWGVGVAALGQDYVLPLDAGPGKAQPADARGPAGPPPAEAPRADEPCPSGRGCA